MQTPTPYPQLNDVLYQLTEKIQSVLSQNLVGANLQGSFAIGDFDNGSQIIEQSTHCNTVVVRWTLREKGVVLAEAHPATFIEPISVEILRKDIYETLIGWGEEILEKPEAFQNRFFQSYLVLNYSRMLCDLHLGEAGSKLRGIKWAKEMLDPQWASTIDFCWEERQNPSISIHQEAKPEVYAIVLEFVEYVMDEAKAFAQKGT